METITFWMFPKPFYISCVVSVPNLMQLISQQNCGLILKNSPIVIWSNIWVFVWILKLSGKISCVTHWGLISIKPKKNGFNCPQVEFLFNISRKSFVLSISFSKSTKTKAKQKQNKTKKKTKQNKTKQEKQTNKKQNTNKCGHISTFSELQILLFPFPTFSFKFISHFKILKKIRTWPVLLSASSQPAILYRDQQRAVKVSFLFAENVWLRA